MYFVAGVLPRSIGIAPEKALKMAAWDGGLSLVNYAYPECPKSMQWMFAGSVAGAATTIIGELPVFATLGEIGQGILLHSQIAISLSYFAGCPSERAMVLAQIQKKGFINVLRNAGIRGLYHGAVATLYRDISFNACMFVIREHIFDWYKNRFGERPGLFWGIVWGLPATITAGIVGCPFDVVKTRIQGTELKNLSKLIKAIFHRSHITSVCE